MRPYRRSSTFKFDLGSEDADGWQDSTVSVFTGDGDGRIRHRYSAPPRMDDAIAERGIDLLAPVWQVLDLTPQGRDDWYPELAYQSATSSRAPGRVASTASWQP